MNLSDINIRPKFSLDAQCSSKGKRLQDDISDHTVVVAYRPDCYPSRDQRARIALQEVRKRFATLNLQMDPADRRK